MGGAAFKGRRKDVGKGGKGTSSQQTEVTPAIRRRRRALLGSEETQQFESLAPFKQFTEYPDYDDAVFDRLGMKEANDFRNKASSRCNFDGYLAEHCIELLGLGVGPPSTLSKRLFNIAQVSSAISLSPEHQDEEAAPDTPPTARKALMTCYELLALYSVLRAGSLDELLELLFCIFDVDGDDKVSVDDFAESIGCYLTLGFDLDDSDELRSLQGREKDRDAAVRRLAIETVKKYSGPNDAASEEFSKTATQLSAEEAALASSTDETLAKPGGQAGETSSTVGQSGTALQRSGSSKRSRSFSLLRRSKKKEPSADGKEKPLLHDLDDDDDDADEVYSSDDETRPRKPKKKDEQEALLKKDSAKKSRRSFSWSRRKKDTGSSEETGAASGKSAGEGGGKDAKAEATASQKAGKSARSPSGKRRGFCGCCSSASRRKSKGKDELPPPLTYEQWRQWFDATVGLGDELVVQDQRPGNKRRPASDAIGELSLQPMGSGRNLGPARGSSFDQGPISTVSSRRILTAADDDNDSGASDKSRR
mmetsp:Transcript_139715/g.243272  ORF Transcript_139715/g.243272 Transcript_139715/m.243272 type:complete len:536 (+) Transcript_139715:54-1661(+)